MTIYTPLGEHRSYARKTNLLPKIRGTDSARGKSAYQISTESRLERIRDRTANTLSREECCDKSLSIELALLENASPRMEDLISKNIY